MHAPDLRLIDLGCFPQYLQLGDILAVISLCSTCLRSATPLPQITPCPLIERYLERCVVSSSPSLLGLVADFPGRCSPRDVRHHGLRIEMGYDEMIHHSDEEEGGVPRHVTAEVLESVRRRHLPPTPFFSPHF